MRWLVAAVAAAFVFAPVFSALAQPFPDVPAAHWAYDAITRLAANNLIQGYPDGAFRGDRAMTRYEVAVAVARIAPATEGVCQYRRGLLGFPIQNEIAFGTLGIALTLVIGIAFWKIRLHFDDLPKLLGQAQWDLKDSWVSTLAAAGGLLGTVFSTSGIFPSNFQTTLLCKPGYASMAAFFGVLTIMALVVYNSWRTTVNLPAPQDLIGFPLRELLTLVAGQPADQPPIRYPLKELLDFLSPCLGLGKVRGYVGIFLVASAITLWSVFGELVTLAMLIWELHLATAITLGVLVLSWVFIGVTLILCVPVYARRWMDAILQDRKTAEELRQMATQGRPQVHLRWSLL